MTLAAIFESIAKIAGLLFVVTSMLAMGLNLTKSQILQPAMELTTILYCI